MKTPNVQPAYAEASAWHALNSQSIREQVSNIGALSGRTCAFL